MQVGAWLVIARQEAFLSSSFPAFSFAGFNRGEATDVQLGGVSDDVLFRGNERKLDRAAVGSALNQNEIQFSLQQRAVGAPNKEDAAPPQSRQTLANGDDGIRRLELELFGFACHELGL